MTTHIKNIPEAGVPFPISEYGRRLERVTAAIEKAGLDALLVTSHGHLRYLSGYHGFGAYFAPFPLIVIPGRQPIYVVREFEVSTVQAESWINDIVPYAQQQDFAPVCAEVLRRYGLQAGKIGFELGCWNLAPADVNGIQAHLPDMEVADATRLVASVSAVKSPLEIQAMREAMALTDIVVRTFQSSLREGVEEVQVCMNIQQELFKAGGTLYEAPTLVFGERTKLSHGSPSRNALRKNDPAIMEMAGVPKHGYVAGLVRSAVLGRNPETESLHSLAEEALEYAISVIKPGVTTGEVDAAARSVITRSGRPKVFRHRTGYQTGIHWLERGNLSLEPKAVERLEVGMNFHMPMLLFSETGRICGCSEQVVVTDSGAEILSSTPHTLYYA
ncbi:Xaa-Pro peptidase family protein [Mesorhizobium sp.]|uniref:M24 family metallopeptidase n=1 Tax=Mesorhizobium sp. TaxID=1871066 RepID=UPI000FE8BB64|nr:Xaa-Pro peptidase family protein [Mesorhizobium sp.]RWB69685.1 MAG: aminopeptidase P family protein [Mesorhizobium sp.]